MHNPIVVFDIGGTQTRCAIYSPQNDQLIKKVSCRTPNYTDFKSNSNTLVRNALLTLIENLGNKVLGNTTPEYVAVAFPGPINKDDEVLTAPTVWGSTDHKPVAIKSSLQDIWPDSNILLLNDVTAAGYYHLRHPTDSACIVTVSSGIGNKVFINGVPIVGPGGRGGEIGHLQVDHSTKAPPCDCGHYGHLGALASGRASRWQARKLYNENPLWYSLSALGDMYPNATDIPNEAIVAAFHTKDKWTEELIKRLAQPLGRVLAGIHLSIGIERFVLVGGFALALGESYRKFVCRSANESGWNMGEKWDSMIELGAAETDAGMVGAGRYTCMNATQQKTGIIDDSADTRSDYLVTST